jgi:exodeoxyribonuclease III
MNIIHIPMSRIISYNVNGLRSAIEKGFYDWLKNSMPDILCIQEIKLQEDQLDKMLFEYLGYYQYWNFAEKKGYSGVGILTKRKPDYISYGIGMQKYDIEGRVIRLDFGNISLVNSYFPSGTTGDVRQEFKMEYLASIKTYLENIRKYRNNIILSGDFNIAHKPEDINHPERHKNSSGFLPEEREWMDKMIDSGYIDTFRVFEKNPEQYSWWSYRANSRAKNLGWRIDYHFITNSLYDRLKGAGIMQEVVHSDHCPVWIEISGLI